MTMPDERYRAVLAAKSLLEEIAYGQTIKRIPKELRTRAHTVLRHYPNAWDMDRCVEGNQVFAKSLDPLYKMVKRHEMGLDIEEELTAHRREQK